MNENYIVVRPRLHPDFELPQKAELLKIRQGDSVKLMFQAGNDTVERMWVTVTDCSDDDQWTGAVDSEAIQEHTADILPVGKRVTFHPLDIIAIY